MPPADKHSAARDGASTEGYRLFSVVETLDTAVSITREQPWYYFGLALTGILPLASLLLILQYFAARRIFATSYDYDYVVVLAGAFLPVLVVWRGLAGAAMTRTSVAGLNPHVGPPPSLFASLVNVGGGRVIVAHLWRFVALWLGPLLAVIFVSTVDSTMDLGLRLSLVVVVVCLLIPVQVAISGWTLLAIPSVVVGSRASSSTAFMRSVALSFLLGFLYALLFVNLHAFVFMVLTLADALFGVDVSYWQQFLSLGHGLYLTALLSVALVLLEPIIWVAPAMLYVDTRVRDEAMDLAGAIDALVHADKPRFGRGHRARHTSDEGDREPISRGGNGPTGAGAAGLVILALALAMPGRAYGQDELFEVLQSRVETGEAGTSGAELEDAVALLDSFEADQYADLTELRSYCQDRILQHQGSIDEDYWRSVVDSLNQADIQYGADRARSLAMVRVRLAGPRLHDDRTSDDGGETQLTAGAVRPAVEEILARDEFEDLSAPEVARGNVEGLITRRDSPEMDELEQWCCNPEQNRTGGEPGGKGLHVPPSVFQMIAIVLLVFALLLVVLAIVRRLTRPDSHVGCGTDSQLGQRIEDQQPGQEDALAFSALSWTSRARQLASAGDTRAAIRALYLALLVGLHRSEFIVYDRWTTNREYELMLSVAVGRGRGSEMTSRTFARITEVFDFVWYGGHEAEPESFERCLRSVEAIGAELGLEREDAP